MLKFVDMGSKDGTVQKGLQSALRENIPSSEEEEQHKRRESVLELNGYIVQETIGTGAFSNVKVRFLDDTFADMHIKILHCRKPSQRA